MTAPVPVGGDGIDSIEAVLAFHRCSDVHPDRHDQGGVGVCTACRSWAAHVAAALRASAPEDGLRAAVEAPAGECGSCGETPEHECPKSKRPCGHHCNHIWTHDACDWCGAEVDDEGQVVIPATAKDHKGEVWIRSLRGYVTMTKPGLWHLVERGQRPGFKGSECGVWPTIRHESLWDKRPDNGKLCQKCVKAAGRRTPHGATDA